MARKENSKPLNAVQRIRARATEDIIIGIIATEMGYANGSNVIASGKAVFAYIQGLSYREFRNIKKLYSETTNNKTEATK